MIAILLVIVLLALYISRIVVFASLVGIGVGILVGPVMDTFQRKLKIPRSVIALIVAVFLLGVVFGLGYFITDLFFSQFVPVLEKIPDALESLRVMLLGEPQAREWVERGVERANLGQVVRESIGTLLRGVWSSVLALGLLIYAIALGIYLAVAPTRYRTGFLSVFPAYKRSHIAGLMSEAGSELRRWFLAQLVSMAFVGTLSAVGLWLIGIEQWLVLGLLTGMIEFVPYLGPIIATILATLVAFTGDPGDALWVLGLYLVIQQLESNFITPLVMKTGVELPPVHLLILATLFGTLFGLPGVFLAAPILTVLRTLYLRTYAVSMDAIRSSPSEATEAEEAA